MNGARSEAEVIRRSRVAQKKPWASAQGVSFDKKYHGVVLLIIFIYAKTGFRGSLSGRD
jgi:hypothetical protein